MKNPIPYCVTTPLSQPATGASGFSSCSELMSPSLRALRVVTTAYRKEGGSFTGHLLGCPEGQDDASQKLAATTGHPQRSLRYPSVLPAKGISPIPGPHQFYDPGRHRPRFLPRLDLLHASQLATAT